MCSGVRFLNKAIDYESRRHIAAYTAGKQVAYPPCLRVESTMHTGITVHPLSKFQQNEPSIDFIKILTCHPKVREVFKKMPNVPVTTVAFVESTVAGLQVAQASGLVSTGNCVRISLLCDGMAW